MKGEPGCSHRLFLVAYIIAAKYRCCVELAALLQEHEDLSVDLERRRSRNDHVYEQEYHNQRDAHYHSNHHSRDRSDDYNSIKQDSEYKELRDRVLQARERAELILSNHEWVRLLCLGSFIRPPPPSPSSQHQQHPSRSTAAAGGAAPSGYATIGIVKPMVSARTSPYQQPMAQPSSPYTSPNPDPKYLPIHSPSPCDTTRGNSAHDAQYPAHASTAIATPVQVKSAPSSPSMSLAPSTILQVEDLDRMETEFLTFLEFDLTTRSQDLTTCWNLLVGNKDN